MEVLLLLIPLSFFMAGMGLLAFLWANRRGQFDDLQGPAEAMLCDDEFVDTHQEHGG
ncbi:MAG: cbb3-type cytochrome oxidase assembly protein CcoS [Oligoflexus sp.]